MLYVKITYSNGYCGCDETEIKAFESMKDAEAWADEEISNYAESYTHVATGWDNDWEEGEEEEYYENCSYSIEEISKEEYEEDNDD